VVGRLTVVLYLSIDFWVLKGNLGLTPFRLEFERMPDASAGYRLSALAGSAHSQNETV